MAAGETMGRIEERINAILSLLLMKYGGAAPVVITLQHGVFPGKLHIGPVPDTYMLQTLVATERGQPAKELELYFLPSQVIGIGEVPVRDEPRIEIPRM